LKHYFVSLKFPNISFSVWCCGELLIVVVEIPEYLILVH
jgi:hypothetical protein